MTPEGIQSGFDASSFICLVEEETLNVPVFFFVDKTK